MMMSWNTSYLQLGFLLFIWTFVVIGFFNWYDSEIVQRDCTAMEINSRILLRRVTDQHYQPNVDKSYKLVNQEVATDDENILIDHTVWDEKKKIAHIEAHFPSLPIVFWSEHKTFKQQENASCAIQPSLFELKFNNIYWQSMFSSDGNFQLYGAYYDKRTGNTPGPVVRILAMVDRVKINVKTFCHLWFDLRHKPAIVEVSSYIKLWREQETNQKPDAYHPYQLICHIPEFLSELLPHTVSLVEKPCDNSTNNLRIINNQLPHGYEKKEFAVCVKPLNYPYEDISATLVEWIELLSIMGVDKVFFYQLQLHANVSKVLNHYEQAGKVELMPFTLPGKQPNAPGMQYLYLNTTPYARQLNEYVPINDCFYKNIYRYEYVVILNIENMIMSKAEEGYNWADIMRMVLNDVMTPYTSNIHSYCYDGKIDANFETDMGSSVHCMHDTSYVTVLNNPYPLGCLHGDCAVHHVKSEIGQSQRFRPGCTVFDKNYKNVDKNLVPGKILNQEKYTYLKEKTFYKLCDLGFLRQEKQIDNAPVSSF